MELDAVEAVNVLTVVKSPGNLVCDASGHCWVDSQGRLHFFDELSGMTASITAPVAFTPVDTTVDTVVTAKSATATTAQPERHTITNRHSTMTRAGELTKRVLIISAV